MLQAQLLTPYSRLARFATYTQGQIEAVDLFRLSDAGLFAPPRPVGEFVNKVLAEFNAEITFDEGKVSLNELVQGLIKVESMHVVSEIKRERAAGYVKFSRSGKLFVAGDQSSFEAYSTAARPNAK